MNTPAPTPTTTTTDKPTGTEYVVLKQFTKSAGGDHTNMAGGRETWEPVDTVKANSAEAAIHACAEKASSQPQDNTHNTTVTLVAIPARSWRPLKVSVEKVTKVTFVGA